ncbi:MAG: hypothetical protein AB8H79_15520 [Myxococcota bacterium]
MVRLTVMGIATALAITACAREKPFTAPTPWENGQLREANISGSFRTKIGGSHPGAGPFEVLGVPYGDMSRAQVHDVGATWRVVQIQLLDHSPDGWRILELDIAENQWIAGAIAVDGTLAGGTLTEPDGTVSYLLNGRLNIDRAGLSDGQVVSGTFTDIDLVDVP